MKYLLALSIILICATNLLAQRSDLAKDCFQTLLNDNRFIDTVKNSELIYCEESIIFIPNNKDSINNYLFLDKKLISIYPKDQKCSTLSFNEIQKKIFRARLSTPEWINTSNSIHFECKIKIKDNACLIKKVKIKKIHRRAKLL